MSILFEDLIQPGATWSHVLKRGTSLRITDVEGGANVGAIFYNSENPSERYNMPDTLKAQHIARFTRGNVLYSDMGRILCSITDDSAGWHDPLSGCTNAAQVIAKYGEKRYQEHRNAFHRNAYDAFRIELAKYGLSARDMVAPINFFSKVVVDEAGDMRFVARHSQPETVGRALSGPARAFIELRAEMNVLVILNTCPHPLDPNPRYEPKPVHLAIGRVPSPSVDDVCRLFCPENVRGFELTERYAL